MTTWFTSDLHLGHHRVAETRGFFPTADMDNTIIENINSLVNKRDKLFILGDLAFTDAGLQQMLNLKCKNVELIMGNHDQYPAIRYLKAGIQKLHGFRGYKTFWLSHAPMHPNELRKKQGNLHGHIHKFGDTPPIEDKRYYNVNVEFHGMKPVQLETIQEYFKAGDSDE
jgi:calcineurin-like phosphoesterase family protein